MHARRPRRRWHRVPLALAALLLLAASLTACASSSSQGKPGVALILKTLTNPYFVAMREAAQKAADKYGVRLSISAGTQDGDSQNQINQIYTAIARGDKGILITSNGNAVNAAIKQARDKGLYVIALDTPPIPANAVDNTYATDNTQAGRLIGQYAAKKLAGKKAVVAMLDLYSDQAVTVDVNRDHGFLLGMGINPRSSTINGREARTGNYTGGSYQIACHQPTQGAVDGGRTAAEQCISANRHINVMYTINEASAQGAAKALASAGLSKQVTLVTIDGSCLGMSLVKNGTFAADATQYPGDMAAIGVKAIDAIYQGVQPPAKTSGKDYYDTGTNLVALNPPSGLKVQTPDQGLKRCWGTVEAT